MKTSYPILDKIDLPSDLKKLDYDELSKLSNELRNFLIESVAGIICSYSEF